MKKTFDKWIPFQIIAIAALAVCLVVVVSRTDKLLDYNQVRAKAYEQMEQQQQELQQLEQQVQQQQQAEAAVTEEQTEPPQTEQTTQAPSEEPSEEAFVPFEPAAVQDTLPAEHMSAVYVKQDDGDSQELSLSSYAEGAADPAMDGTAEEDSGEMADSEEESSSEQTEESASEETESGSAESSTQEGQPTAFHLYEGETIQFGLGEEYTELVGITTFRGNNFRDTAAYGMASMVQKQFSELWTVSTAGLYDSSGAVWSGSGWTGQPMVVQWPEQTKQVMNLYDWAKEKEGLVEVILPCLDGKVYFLDLETGESTRDTISLGYSFKGTGSVDPRGYPLLYVGGGLLTSNYSQPRIMVVSLITGEVLYTVGDYDSYATRQDWTAFDSAPLLDEQTDTLIYPGENGIIYFLRLNIQYDPQAGTVSVDPSVTRWKYESEQCEEYYYGMEDSAVAWQGHLMIADNGGNFFCLDLDTLEVEWCMDCLDDTNCSPVLSIEDGHPYVYLSTSFHYGWRSYYTATIPIWKIDAVNGSVIWQRDYTCYTESGVSGGVQGTPALGKGSLEGMLFVNVGMTPNAGTGILVALDTETGEEIWKKETPSFSWSSPVCFYDTEGNGYVLNATHGGSLWLYDGLTGEELDEFDTEQTLEASPVVYENTLVIGSRWNTIWALRLQ